MKNLLRLLALAVLATLHGVAAAQSGATLTLRHLETEAFPIIAGYLDARDATGARVSDLQPSQLQALEDGQSQPVDQLRTIQTGLRVILVINPAESFNIRDGEGTTRFDYAKQQILGWAASLPSDSATSLSLVTPEGVRMADQPAAAWIAEVELIQPDFPDEEVDTQTLVRALELAAQDGPEPGLGTAIWWLTASPQIEALDALPDWQTSLSARGVSLFIWQIDSQSNFQGETAGSLQSLAQASGGQWFGFSGSEEFPEPETYFNPIRTAYFFQYQSQLHSSGIHEVQIQLDIESSSISSQVISFELNLLPPNPILVTPPTQIQRAPSAQDPSQLAPFSQPIEILVEFPDHFERNLIRTTLFVNDELVAENTSSPFTRFAWDISEYDVGQQVLLRVEAEDELGLVGSTIEFPIQILVIDPPSGLEAFMSRGGPVLVTGGLLAAAAFLLIMVLSGRIKPARLGESLFRPSKPEPQVIDPLSDSPLLADGNEKMQNAGAAIQAPAYLQQLVMQDTGEEPQILPIDRDEILIGSAKDCHLIINEESVSLQHARLARVESGYQVVDLGSEAGTWVNYAPVSIEGSTLRNGDLLHIGRVAFRFFVQAKDSPVSQ